jgi:hypothetical protein
MIELLGLSGKKGYKNINSHYSDFDYLLFIDNSQEALPALLFEMERYAENSFALRKYCEELPEYTERRLPAIFKLNLK